VRDTWTDRELAVLDATVSYTDQNPLMPWLSVGEVARMTGLDVMDVLRAANALDGPYVEVTRMMSGGDPSPWRLSGVTAAARQAVGQWPSGESLVEQLVAGLRAAELSESDPVQKSRLHALVDALTGIARDVVVQVATSVVTRSIGQV
jgi:hypothetical protein